METLAAILLLAAALAALILLSRPRPAFVLVVKEGKARVKKGKVLRGFIEDCEDLISEGKIQRATIKGFMKSGHLALRFSHQIPKSYHQRFRNAWGFHA